MPVGVGVAGAPTATGKLSTGTPPRRSVRTCARRSTSMVIGVVAVVTADERIQPRVPLGRIGSCTWIQSAPRVPVTRNVRTAPSAVRAEKCRISTPFGAP